MSILGGITSRDMKMSGFEMMFGKLDRFMNLSKASPSANNTRIWAPVLVLPCLVTYLLFPTKYFTPNIRYLAIASMSCVLAVSVFVAFVSDDEPKTSTSGLTTLSLYIPYTFSPYYPVYPVTQLLLILIAGSGLMAKDASTSKGAGRVRFYLSILATAIGAGVAWYQTPLKPAPKESLVGSVLNHVIPLDQITDVIKFKATFLDQIFLTTVCVFSVLVPWCLSKSYKERIRVIHGVVIMYDLYKLLCIKDTPAKLFVSHLFGPPLLLAFDAIEAAREQDRKSVDDSTFKPISLPVVAVFAQPQPVPAQNVYVHAVPAIASV